MEKIGKYLYRTMQVVTGIGAGMVVLRLNDIYHFEKDRINEQINNDYINNDHINNEYDGNEYNNDKDGDKIYNL